MTQRLCARQSIAFLPFSFNYCANVSACFLFIADPEPPWTGCLELGLLSGNCVCIKAGAAAALLHGPALASSELDGTPWLAGTGLCRPGLPRAGQALGKKARPPADSALSYFAGEFRRPSVASDTLAAGSS